MGPVIILALGVLAIAYLLLVKTANPRGVGFGISLVLFFFGTRAQSDRLEGGTLIIIVIVLTLTLLKERRRPANVGPMLLLGAYLGLLLPTTALENQDALPALARMIVVVALTAQVVRGMNPQEVVIVHRYLVLSGFLQLAFAVYEASSGAPYWGYELTKDGSGLFIQQNELVETGLPRLEGATGHSIVFGFSLVLAVYAVFKLMNPRFALAALLSAPFLVGLIFSGSRSSFAALALAGLLPLLSFRSGMRLSHRLLWIAVALTAAATQLGYLREIAEELGDSGSFRHRLRGILSAEELLDRPLLETIFGAGFNSEMKLFDRGYFQDSTFQVVDNQFVYTLGTAGLAGLIILTALLITAWFTAARAARPLLILIIAMAFSFDVMTWYSCVAVIVFAVCMPPETGKTGQESGVGHGSEGESRSSDRTSRVESVVGE